MRSMTWNFVDWIEPGSSLEQSFSTDGFVTAISVDLEAGPGDYVVGAWELLSADGRVIGEKQLVRAQFPLDRFGRFLGTDRACTARRVSRSDHCADREPRMADRRTQIERAG